MAEPEASGSSEQTYITFNVKAANDAKYVITLATTATVTDLKTKLSTSEFADIPTERQRLIYSGRVLKDGDTLASTKLKDGHTIHLVKGAASNARQNPASSSSSSGSAVPSVPTNIAAGTGNNPLAALTGARYAGFHGLPSASSFGADGGMGPPPNPEELDRMLDNPNFLSQMNEMMNNPAFLEMMEQSPMLRDNPIARQMFRDPAYRRMILDPNIIRAQARAQRGLARGPTFPAPGVTDTTPQAQGAQNTAGQGENTTANTSPSQPPLTGMFGSGAAANPFAALFGPGATGTQNPASAADPNANSSATPANPFGNLFGSQPSPEFMRAMLQGMGGGAPPAEGAAPSGDSDQMAAVTRLMSNPDFMRAMGNAMGGGAGGAPGGDGGLGALLGGLGGGGFGSPPPPADTRPPEERYADQLQQLNDMGFYEFERNVQALRRSGGSVQGAVEYLLSNTGS